MLRKNGNSMFRSCVLLAVYGVGLFLHVGAIAASASPVLTGNTPQGTRIEIFSDLDPLVINRIHSWHIRILDSNGNPVLADMRISGGMPEHDHGMPTAPQITGQLENGDYLMEGMRFHMPGHWQLLFELTIDGNEQVAVIDFQL